MRKGYQVLKPTPPDKMLRKCIRILSMPEENRRLLLKFLPKAYRAVREDCAKRCDAQAAFYRSLKKKGPGGMVDADTARAFGAEDCAATIRAK